MDRPSRRALLGWIAASPLTAIGGCLGEGGAGGADEDGDNEDDETDDGTAIPDATTVVVYQDLTDRGQQFVDRTFDRHALYWIFRQGGERQFVTRDPDSGQWVPDEDPLSLESVDEELKEVYRGEAILVKDGKYYERVATVGHDPYRTKFTVNEGADCGDSVDVGELSEIQVDVAAVLFEDGEAWVAEEEYEPIADADVLWTNDRDDVAEFREMAMESQSLTDGNRTVRLDIMGLDVITSAGWALERVKTKND